jgi:hypothetical protein
MTTQERLPKLDDKPRTTLYVNHWTPGDARRRREIDECLRHNLGCQSIDRIVLLAQSTREHRSAVPRSEKLNWVELPSGLDRPDFQHFFETVNRWTITPYDLNIVANSDVFFDESSKLEQLRRLDLENACLSISRREWVAGQEREMAGSNSRDVWIFQGKIRPLGWSNFPPGVYCCDWRLDWELYHCDYYVCNPCHTIRVYHLHDSGIRNNGSPVPGPHCPNVHQCTLDECNFQPRRRCQYGLIAFSLYGREPRFLVGAEENAKMAKFFYPGWTVRFYVDDSVPDETIAKFHHLKCDVVRMSGWREHHRKFWRLFAADDPGYERWMVRDVDSRFTLRERMAVEDWVKSGKPFHVVRDHPWHVRPILCCAFGGMRSGFPDGMRKAVESWIASGGHSGYACDEDFLEQAVWPKIKDCALVHDTFQGTPVPCGMEFGRFVGERIFEDNHHGHDDRMVFMNAYLGRDTGTTKRQAPPQTVP